MKKDIISEDINYMSKEIISEDMNHMNHMAKDIVGITENI